MLHCLWNMIFLIHHIIPWWKTQRTAAHRPLCTVWKSSSFAEKNVHKTIYIYLRFINMYSYNKCEKNNNAKAYRAATFCLFSHCSQIRKNASLTCSDDAYDIKMMSLKHIRQSALREQTTTCFFVKNKTIFQDICTFHGRYDRFWTLNSCMRQFLCFMSF